jgi:hypothetical protein
MTKYQSRELESLKFLSAAHAVWLQQLLSDARAIGYEAVR